MTDTATLTMPLRKVTRATLKWSPERFRRAIEVERQRTGERKTALLLRLASAADTTVQTIYAWGKGEGRPGYDETFALAKELRVDPEAFGE